MLKIISLHIPKTAGRSFYQILKWAYKEKIDLPHNRGKYVQEGTFNEKEIDFDQFEILHGHLFYRHIEHLHKKYNSKIVTWLRDPVDRVISNYYYNISMNLEKSWKRQAEQRKEMSLLEFAKRPQRRNVMSKTIEGIKAEDIFFIGITERFNDDIIKLGKLLEWPEDIPQITENKGTRYYNNPEIPTEYKQITDDMRMNIRELNFDDVNLYEKIVFGHRS